MFIRVDKGVCVTITIKKKLKDTKFLSSDTNNKRMQGMGKPFQYTSECKRKQPINTLMKLQKTTPVINFKYKHLFIKTWKGVEKQNKHLMRGKRSH